jgi:hypothetical protein
VPTLGPRTMAGVYAFRAKVALLDSHDRFLRKAAEALAAEFSPPSLFPRTLRIPKQNKEQKKTIEPVVTATEANTTMTAINPFSRPSPIPLSARLLIPFRFYVGSAYTPP